MDLPLPKGEVEQGCAVGLSQDCLELSPHVLAT